MQSSTYAYVLHSRPFKESHLIVDVYTLAHGRMSVMARNAKTHHPRSRIWQAFILLELSWRGAGDLPSVTEAEALDYSVQLTGTPLFCGVYLNELLQKLLPKSEACPALWHMYQQSLKQLSVPHLLEPCLRRFELNLLQELGLGIDFHHDSQGDGLEDERHYHYYTGQGWVVKPSDIHSISGAMIQRIAACLTDVADDDWVDKVSAEDQTLWLSAKRLTRRILTSALAGQTLQSRQLFAMIADSQTT